MKKQGIHQVPEPLTREILTILYNHLQRDIHFLDKRGLILASTQKELEGQIFQQNSILLSKKNGEEPFPLIREGTRKEKGLGMFLHYKGERIGAIGITGPPQEIKPFISLAKEIALLTINNYFLEEKNLSLMALGLEENEIICQDLIERAMDGIMIIKDSRIHYGNKSLVDMVGYSLEEVIGREFHEYIHPKEKSRVVQMYQDRMAGKDIPNLYETILLHQEGYEIKVEINAGLMDYQGQKANLVIIRDITQRKEVEEKHRQSERLLQDILDFLPDATFAINQYREVILWNKAAEKLTGIKSQDILGKKDQAYTIPLYGERRKTLIDLVNEDLEKIKGDYSPLTKIGGKTITGEIFSPFIGEKGSYLWVKATPLYQGKGEMVGAIESIRDITTYKEAERVLSESIEKLKELDQIKNEFISNISHELRTPLTSIIGFSEIVKKKVVKLKEPVIEEKKRERLLSQIEENLAILIHESKNLMLLIEDILAIAQLESRKVEWKKERFSLNETILEIIKEKESQLYEKKLKLNLELENDIILNSDQEKISRVIREFFTNAIKFTLKGSITIKTRVRCDEVLVGIADTGIGFQKEEKDGIFDKFVQVQNRILGKPQGTGLGLSICKEIICQAKGRIFVESTPGKGSTFSFTLPLSENKRL